MLKVAIRQTALILWTMLIVGPFLLILLLSLRNQRDIFAYPLGFGGDLTFNNYVDAWNGPVGGQGLATYAVNSLVIAVVALIVSLGFGVPGAYFGTYLSPRPQRLFLLIFVVAIVVPFALLVVPLFQIFDTFGLTSNPVAVGVAYGAMSVPVTVLIMYSYFVDFPRELTEAAQLDGLSPIGTFLVIVMPLSKGALFAVSLLALIYIWGESQLGIVLLQASGSQSIPVGLLGFRGQWNVELGPIFAGLTMASLPIILIYLAFNKSISKGIALGGVFR